MLVVIVGENQNKIVMLTWKKKKKNCFLAKLFNQSKNVTYHCFSLFFFFFVVKQKSLFSEFDGFYHFSHGTSSHISFELFVVFSDISAWFECQSQQVSIL